MNELRETLSNLQTARAEEGDPGLDELLDQRIEAIETRLIELGECRAEMQAVLARAAA